MQDALEFEDIYEEDFEELLSNEPVKSQSKETPLLDPTDSTFFQKLEKSTPENIRDNTLIVRKNAHDLLAKGKVSESLTLVSDTIFYLNFPLIKKDSLQLKIFIVFLYENIGWLVNKLFSQHKKLLASQDKIYLLSKGIASIKKANKLSKEALYGVSSCNRIEILIQWQNLLTELYKITGDTNSNLLEIKYIQNELLEVKKNEAFKHIEINKRINFSIAHHKFYYEVSKKENYLDNSQKAKKVVVAALEDFIKWLNPLWSDARLEFDCNPLIFPRFHGHRVKLGCHSQKLKGYR